MPSADPDAASRAARVAERDRHEVVRTDRLEVLQLRGDRTLVADDGDVGRTLGAFAVEHGAVRRQEAVHLEVGRSAFARRSTWIWMAAVMPGRSRGSDSSIWMVTPKNLTPRRSFSSWASVPTSVTLPVSLRSG